MTRRESLRARRRRIRRRRRALIFGLAGIAGVVLITVAARSLLDLSAQEKGGKKTETVQKEEILETVPVPQEEQKSSGQVTISAAGDFTLGTDENFDYSTSLPAKYDEVGGPDYFLSQVREVFAGDDLTIVNLEGPLTESEERAEKQFSFRGDPAYTGILTSGSVEACNLANNHSKDYGIQGYQDTIANVEGAGIVTFGYERTAIYEANGIRIGLAGVYELAEGMECEDDMTAAIQALKEDGADLVIVSFHWGIEKENYPDDTQKALAHAAIDQGADLVLGHHPHVLQGIEKYQGKYIVYSLGNFCFGGNKNPSDKDTMIFQQTFTVNKGEVEEDDAVKIIPCRISSSDERNNYQPVLAEGEEAQRIMDRIKEYSQPFGTQLPSEF